MRKAEISGKSTSGNLAFLRRHNAFRKQQNSNSLSSAQVVAGCREAAAR